MYKKDHKQFFTIVEARSHLYHFFSSFYLIPPTETSLSLLKERISDPAITKIFDTQSIKKVKDSLENLQQDCAGIIQEFHNLFLVPGHQYVTPYESCFREKRIKKGKIVKGLLMGKSTRRVKKFYRENGLEISQEFMDLPDHIVLELNLMHYLCQVEKKAWEQEDNPKVIDILKREKQFIEDHLIQWVPALCNEICEKTRYPFYDAMARMTEEFIKTEQSTFHPLAI